MFLFYSSQKSYWDLADFFLINLYDTLAVDVIHDVGLVGTSYCRSTLSNTSRLSTGCLGSVTVICCASGRGRGKDGRG